MYLVQNESRLVSDLDRPESPYLQLIAERFKSVADCGLVIRSGDLRPATQADLDRFRVKP